MASFWCNKFVAGYLNGTHSIDLDSDTIKVMLCNTIYIPNQIDDEFIDDGDLNDALRGETAASGYGARKTLTATITAESPAADQVKFDAADPTVWTNIGDPTADAAVRYMPVYHHAGDDDANRQIINLDFGSNKNLNGVDFTVQFDSSGLGYAESI